MTNKGRNIDVARRDDRRAGVFERCEVIAVYPHVSPAPGDVTYNCVDLQLMDRPRDCKNNVIKRYDVPVAQWDHGKFRGTQWTPRVGDLVIIAWLTADEPMVLCTLPAHEQEPVCRSEADDQQQEIVHKIAPHENPTMDENGNFTIFPSPKHPDCYKYWPKTRDSITVFDCAVGHNKPSCCKDAPCTCLDDHQASTCFKNFSEISPTTIDKPWRFKFLHHVGSYWYFDDDAVWRICGKKSAVELGFIHHYTNGKMEINSPVEALVKAPLITLDGDVVITGDLRIEGNNAIIGACAHGACSCLGGGGGGTSGTCTGTGEANQAVAHGMVDNLGNACSPSSIVPTCQGGGSCVVTGCDDIYFYVTCTAGEVVDWVCSAPEDGWGNWAPCF